MCNAYYQCANGHQYPDQFCPGDLLFNGDVCDYPQNVTCPITENESCSSEERIWYGDSEIAKVSTDAGKWEENPKKNFELSNMFDSDAKTSWHSAKENAERTKTITIDFQVRNYEAISYHIGFIYVAPQILVLNLILRNRYISTD